MYRVSAVCVLLIVIFGARVSVCQAEELVLASWNVENLFDTEDDPGVQFDEDYSPESPKKWTSERLDIKLKNLAKIIGKMNDNHGPDVLGMCEVENRKVIEMLVEKLAPLGRKYEIVHKDSPSDRGIDCALIYDSNVFKLADSKFHFVEANKTRDILEAKLERDGATLYVFVNHWPSRRNDEWERNAAADVLRKRIDEILAADGNADILMVGDFNDETDNVSMKEHLRVANSQENLPTGAVFDTTARVKDENKGTFVWDDKWQLLDHIIISQGLLNDAGFRWKLDSSHPVEFPEMIYTSKARGAIPRPSKSYSENNFHKTGFSDHLPVQCVIVK